ncbi:hypothetical protein LSG25_15190 [Paralcaligenes sp. KSB-10]|jgi:hypothetical protein|uniref:hypothetical protein n=1 Tax=Paralcaligenes sp. KSB-10 TaxID=2901142 RepID=UPI001E56C7B6|nr:hypothetical protein [Paralcaligenes sp. KSB-10]UHL63385.1 hypothetical protein LSG25_15190 [Paralcaligenes sp. KSB-10]
MERLPKMIKTRDYRSLPVSCQFLRLAAPRPALNLTKPYFFSLKRVALNHMSTPTPTTLQCLLSRVVPVNARLASCSKPCLLNLLSPQLLFSSA